MSKNGIIQKENEIDSIIFNYVFNNHIYYNSINEDSGHPLFKYKDSLETFDWIERIKHIMEILNEKILKIDVDRYVKIKNEKNGVEYKCRILKPISISLNKLGFKNVIDSKNSNLVLKVYDVKKQDINIDDYLFFRNMSGGGFTQKLYNKIEKDKFINIGDKNIMDILCIAVNGKILPISFLNVFLHEYQHFFQNYNYIKNNTIDKELSLISNVQNAIKHLSEFEFNNEEIKALKCVLYRLFQGENYALIGNIFADLISLDIQTLADFNKNKKYLYNFEIYEELKKSIEVIREIDSNKLYNFFNVYNTIFPKRAFTEDGKKYALFWKELKYIEPNELKNKFIKILERRIIKLYTKYMKFVGRYLYMTQQYKNEIINSVKS